MKRVLYLGLLGLNFCIMVASASAATYYVDFSAGVDTNNGASTSAPWKHAPGMTGATGNASSYSCHSGDSFILKGGVKWDYTVLPWTWPCSGTSGNSYYVGGDPTFAYYSSTNCSAAGYSAYCRPIINGGGATGCSGSPCYDTTTTAHHFIVWNVSYADLAQVEMTGLYWGGNASANFGSAFYISAQSVAHANIHDNYFHGWAHPPYPTSAEGEGCCAVILGSTGVNGNPGVSFYNNVVDGSDTDKQSFGVSYGGPGIFYNNYINYAFSDGFNGSYCQVYGNTMLNFGISYSAGVGIHDNAFESNTDCSAGLLFYDNYMAHVNTANVSEGLVAFAMSPQAGTKSYAFNNVFADMQSYGSADNVICANAIAGAGAGGTCVFMNQTEECGLDAGSGPSGQCGAIGKPSAMVVINNHFITSGTCPTFTNAGGAATTYTSNVCESKSTAESNTSMHFDQYSLTTTYPFTPVATTNSTVGAGTNQTSSYCSAIGVISAAAGTACVSDSTVGVGYDSTNHTVLVANRTANARPPNGAWDVGGYQFSALAPPQNLVVVVH